MLIYSIFVLLVFSINAKFGQWVYDPIQRILSYPMLCLVLPEILSQECYSKYRFYPAVVECFLTRFSRCFLSHFRSSSIAEGGAE